MKRLFPAGLLIVAVLLSFACAGKKSGASGESSGDTAPLTVLVDTVISGDILGQPLRAPYGAAVDFRGNVYITEAGNHRVIAFNEALVPQREIGGYGSEAGQFNRPGFITVDNGLTILVSDRGNLRLARYNATLTFVNEIDLIRIEEPGQFGEPSGVALSPYGEIWMADWSKDRVAVFSNADQFDRYVAEFGYTGGQVSSPSEIVELRNGGFLICDAGNSRVSVYDEFGNFVRSLGDDHLSRPVAAAQTADALWILDHDPTRLLCFSERGKLLLELPAQLSGLDRALTEPTDIAALRDGRLLLVDSGNNRLVIVAPLFKDD